MKVAGRLVRSYRRASNAARVESFWSRVGIGGLSALAGAVVAEAVGNSLAVRSTIVFLVTALSALFLSLAANYAHYVIAYCLHSIGRRLP